MGFSPAEAQASCGSRSANTNACGLPHPMSNTAAARKAKTRKAHSLRNCAERSATPLRPLLSRFSVGPNLPPRIQSTDVFVASVVLRVIAHLNFRRDFFVGKKIVHR